MQQKHARGRVSAPSAWGVAVCVAVVLGLAWGSHAALPINEQWRLDLMDTCQGFACPGLQTVDYSTWSLCTVTTLANTGTDSLRDCATRAGGQWVVFSVSGTITLASTIYLPSNKVLDGRGQDITLTSTTDFPAGNGMLEIERRCEPRSTGSRASAALAWGVPCFHSCAAPAPHRSPRGERMACPR